MGGRRHRDEDGEDDGYSHDFGSLRLQPIKKLSEVVVNSLGRGLFRFKVNCDPRAVASEFIIFASSAVDGDDGSAVVWAR